MKKQKPLLVSSGEPAGIGPDLCLALAGHATPLVVMADKALLLARAKVLNQPLVIVDYQQDKPLLLKPHHLNVLPSASVANAVPGELTVQNVPYVLQMLTEGVQQCQQGHFSALVTAPIHKGIINQAGISFTGHTEFFASHCHVPHVVMMLVGRMMRVALVTTHVALRDVAYHITAPLIERVITEVRRSLQRDFGIACPKIAVAGLNPHAGEGGYLGQEEKEVIIPLLKKLQEEDWDVQGPFSADTMFLRKDYDAFVVMYHDQGLPVLKYASFGHAVNVTLGLPIIRTSVDHGTALELAGTGAADAGSLLAAVDMAANMASLRASN